MPSSRDIRTLGDKLGPKLIAAITQSVIATKKGLLPTEHRLRTKVIQDIIDRMGEEAAEVTRPFIEAALSYHGDDIHPIVAQYLKEAASGQDQVKALSGLFMGVGQTAISSILDTTVAPLAHSVNSHQPTLDLPAVQAAAAGATGIVSIGEAQNTGRRAGYDSNVMTAMIELAVSHPGPPDLDQMVHRGHMSAAQAHTELRRQGYTDNVASAFAQIRPQILTIADAALGVLKGSIPQTRGQQIAVENGYSVADFDTFLLNTGEPIGLEQLLAALRRGFIDDARLSKGVHQSRIRNEWLDVILKLRYSPPSTPDAIQASIQGYMSKAEAKTFAVQNGLEPSAFEALWLTAGEPLSRTEMTDLVNRGEATLAEYNAALRQSRLKDSYIPLSEKLIQRPMPPEAAVRASVQGYLTDAEADHIIGMNGIRQQDRLILREIDGIPLSKQELLRLNRMGKMTRAEVIQGLKESRLKNKYIPFALDLTEQLIPLFEIRLLVHDGAINAAQATKLLLEHGYPADLVKSMVHAFTTSGSVHTKTVTEGMLAELFLEGAITSAQFTTSLESIGYSKAHAAEILQLNEWKVELAQRNALIAKVRAEYVGRKITKQQAETDLTVALVPQNVITRVLVNWDHEIAANVTLLTVAQIENAWQLGLFGPAGTTVNTDTAINRLEQHGYSAADARIVLEIKNKGPLTAG